MANFIIGGILLILVGAAVSYIVKAKQSGVKCIGCPAGGQCPHKGNASTDCGCGCGCNCESLTEVEKNGLDRQ